MECNSKWNVTHDGMSLKWNVSQNLIFNQNGMSVKKECHSKWNVTQAECHLKWNIIQNGMSI